MSIDSAPEVRTSRQQSLATAAARNLATTTKSAPQMQGISSRWLLKMLPWVQTDGGAYRVNRRLSYTIGDGRIEFTQTGSEVRVIPRELGELSLLRGYEDMDVLTALADRFVQREFEPGDVLAQAWRGVPLLPCGKIRVSDHQTSSIIAIRTGEDNEGVIGLHQTGPPDEVEPGLNARFMGIDDKAIISYLAAPTTPPRCSSPTPSGSSRTPRSGPVPEYPTLPGKED